MVSPILWTTGGSPLKLPNWPPSISDFSFQPTTLLSLHPPFFFPPFPLSLPSGVCQQHSHIEILGLMIVEKSIVEKVQLKNKDDSCPVDCKSIFSIGGDATDWALIEWGRAMCCHSHSGKGMVPLSLSSFMATLGKRCGVVYTVVGSQWWSWCSCKRMLL